MVCTSPTSDEHHCVQDIAAYFFVADLVANQPRVWRWCGYGGRCLVKVEVVWDGGAGEGDGAECNSDRWLLLD